MELSGLYTSIKQRDRAGSPGLGRTGPNTGLDPGGLGPKSQLCCWVQKVQGRAEVNTTLRHQHQDERGT